MQHGQARSTEVRQERPASSTPDCRSYLMTGECTTSIPETAKTQAKWDLRVFLNTYSGRKGILMCGMGGRTCTAMLCCPVCAARRSTEHQADLRVGLRTAAPESAMEVTLTVATVPGRPLRDAWADLGALTRDLTDKSWLTKRVDGYARCTDVTYAPAGWHPHQHFILVFKRKPTQARASLLRRQIVRRWLQAADRRGIAAGAQGQHTALLETAESVSKWANYVAQDVVGKVGTDGSMTPGDLLRAAHQFGDADALALFHELEDASFGKRVWSTGGCLRPCAIAHTHAGVGQLSGDATTVCGSGTESDIPADGSWPVAGAGGRLELGVPPVRATGEVEVAVEPERSHHAGQGAVQRQNGIPVNQASGAASPVVPDISAATSASKELLGRPVDEPPTVDPAATRDTLVERPADPWSCASCGRPSWRGLPTACCRAGAAVARWCSNTARVLRLWCHGRLHRE